MSRNGSGTYSLPAGNPVVTGTTISSTWANNTMTDIASALTGSVAADGQTPLTGNLNLNTNKIINLADPTLAQDAVTKSYADTNFAALGGYGFKNRIINGAMVIDQRNAGASVTADDSVFPVDRWKMEVTQSSKLTAQQNAGSVTPPAGFTNYLGLTSSSAYSVSAGDYFCVDQLIEGFNFADMAWGTADAKTVTLSFWVRSSLTGTFGGTLSNSASNRSYPFTYSISSANTWEQKSITITGDTSGTWLTTNGVGLRLRFGLGAGATYSGTAGAWAGATYLSATGATSVVGTNGATFYITGVQLEVGSTATNFDTRPYTTELQLCQRYYYRLKATAANYPFGFAQCYSTTLAGALISYPVTMRTAPSALEQSGTAGDYAVYTAAGSQQVCTAVPTYAGVLTTTAYGAVNFTVASGIVAGNVTQGYGVNSSAYLGWSAEL